MKQATTTKETTMTRRMSDETSTRIGQIVSALLAHAADQGFQLTTMPVTVEDDQRNGWNVTLHACREDNADIEVQATVTGDGVIVGATTYRYWDGDGMSTWDTYSMVRGVD